MNEADDVPDERYGADGSGHSMCAACGVSTEVEPCPVHQRADECEPVVEHVTGVVLIDLPDGGAKLQRIDGTIIGPRSIARPHALIPNPESAP